MPSPVDAGSLHPTPFHPYPPLTISYRPQSSQPASILESTHTDRGHPMPTPRLSYTNARLPAPTVSHPSLAPDLPAQTAKL